MTTTDSPEEARALARGLVENKLAACVQVVPVESHYAWKGTLTESAELLLLVKTRAALYDEVERFLRERHSYEMPEIVQLPVVAGSPAYLSWIDANTKAGP